MGVQIAKAMGLRVIGIDSGAEKRDLCTKLGCEAFIDFRETKNVVDEVVRLTDGKGAHGIFITAGSQTAYNQAPLMCRVGGKVMCIGLRESDLSSAVTASESKTLIWTRPCSSSRIWTHRSCRASNTHTEERRHHWDYGRQHAGYQGRAGFRVTRRWLANP